MTDLAITSARADGLTSKAQALRVLSRCGSARVLGSATVVALTMRLLVGGFGNADLLVSAATIALIGPVEWALHRSVLHASDDSWSSRRLGTGSGHRRHHQDPADLDWLLLSGTDAMAAVIGFGLLTAAWVSALTGALGTAVLGPVLTGWLLAVVALGHYEWIHLLIHTRYRCRTRWYRRLAANHRRHHHRNERFWLGVTTNTGDRLFGTIPATVGSVPISQTARTLDEGP